MTGREKVGRKAESIALEWLLQRGFRLLEKNYRVGHKEIDLIVESDEKLHIVEVKSLESPLFGHPYDRVDTRKRENLASAARYYIKAKSIAKQVQFDVVSIVFRSDEDYTLEYIPAAFFPVYYNR